jgi:hypothetical protein
MPQWQDQLNRRLSMKKTPDFKLVTFTLLLLTGSLCVGRLTAQAAEAVSAGKFTLPFEVRGGQAILPAGHLHLDFELSDVLRRSDGARQQQSCDDLRRHRLAATTDFG